MDMDKAFFLQKQIKENNQDLHGEFLDMGAWEEQMKKKDLEIRNSKNDERLPAIRSKIKKKCVPVTDASKEETLKKTPKPTPKLQKRAGPVNYDAWDKFDADKACQEIDGNLRTAKTKKIYEVATEEELEKEYAQATIFKNEGNKLVQEKQYAKAVGKYSEAIKVFPHDAAFYANRALCQLKLNNLYSAEGDCTAAIELDQYYIKAYHRRATVRIELKRYKDAQKDLEILLKLEPSNKEAASMLENVKTKIENAPKPMIISGEKPNENESIEKTIGEKLLGKNKDKTFKTKTDSTKESSETEIENIGPELPFWLPKVKKNLIIVQPLTKAKNRLNQTLKRISINDIPTNESIFKDIEEEVKKEETLNVVSNPEENIKIDTVKEVKKKVCAVEDFTTNDIKPIVSSTFKDTKEVNKEETSNAITKPQNNIKIETIKKVEKKIRLVDNSITNDVEATVTLPPPPVTYVHFITFWRKNICSNYRRKYLLQITPKNIPDIFKESMESKLFSEILIILNTEFISNNDKVYDLLLYFGKVKRFRTLVLFMTKEDKEALKNLLKYCKNSESKSDEEINHLSALYEM